MPLLLTHDIHLHWLPHQPESNIQILILALALRNKSYKALITERIYYRDIDSCMRLMENNKTIRRDYSKLRGYVIIVTAGKVMGNSVCKSILSII